MSERVFHRILVIRVPKEVIEAVHGRQMFVEIAEVIFPELSRCVPHCRAWILQAAVSVAAWAK
jgi:hypothetical protein